MQINKTTLVPPCSLYFAVSFLETQGTVELLVVLKSQHILQLSFGGSLSKSNVPNSQRLEEVYQNHPCGFPSTIM